VKKKVLFFIGLFISARLGRRKRKMIKWKNLLCVVMLVTVFQKIQASPIEWSTDVGGNGHFYEVILVSEGITWENANVAALEAGGYLATITSAEENTFVHSLAACNPDFWTDGGICGPWLGGFQAEGSIEPSGGWQWVTGEPFIYTNWTINEPDNGTGGTEHWLQFWDGRTPMPYASTWNDRNSGYTDRPPCSYAVEYIPEPCTLALLALGGLAAARRRR
jgi:hypothetical protein